MRARIDDVARQAGVSTKTVSRVLNEEPSVRGSTRDKVLAAVKALDYRPLPSARSLASNRSFTIALLYDNRSPSYIMEVQAGVLEACETQYYSMIVQPLDSHAPRFIEHVIGIVARHRPDGLVLTPPLTDNTRLVRELRRNGVPFASISPRQPRQCIGTTLKEREAACEMVTYLIKLGHRRIAHIAGDSSHGAGTWRLAGYRDALKQAGIDYECVIPGQFSFASGVNAAKKLFALHERPTAVFAADDDMATGVLWAAGEAGIRVPEDMSLCGFDDTAIASRVWPPLTTIHQPVRDMGRQAATQLLMQIRGQEASMLEAHYKLCARASTGPVSGSRT